MNQAAEDGGAGAEESKDSEKSTGAVVKQDIRLNTRSISLYVNIDGVNRPTLSTALLPSFAQWSALGS